MTLEARLNKKMREACLNKKIMREARLNSSEVPLLLQAHDGGDAGCHRPQSPLPFDGSQLIKDGIQWHKWIPVTKPGEDSPNNGDGHRHPLLVQCRPRHRAETVQLLGDIGEEGDQVRKL
jgi:hypothetical protein